MYHASGGFVKDIDYAAVALGIVGVGVLVSSMWGRARWLVPLGLLLMPIVLVANLINVSVIGPWGNFFVEAQTIENLNQSYRYGGGDVKFRLREDAWVSVSEDVSVEVFLGMGSLALFVPKDVNIVVTTDIGLGTFEVWPNRTYPLIAGDLDRLTHGQDSAVFVAGEQRVYRQSGFPGPTLRFNASVGLGNMSIYQMEDDQ
ncbi:hypothetical protein BMS3Bbin02_01764 [bacterium BMS3Bbin02]|nr:hypothetical protein BMS3Bbin02_01764 [bacterium BMS3Bbin02]